MSADLILILAVAGAALFGGAFLFLQFTGSSAGMRNQMRNLVSGQREVKRTGPRKRTSVLDTADEAGAVRKTTSALTLTKKMKYARWKMPEPVFRILEVVISLVAFAVASIYFNIFIQGLSLLTGPIFMRWLLNSALDRRYNAFDRDYPAMLLSLVGLLKTGMNAMGALEAAAQGLEEDSLVRQEIELMITRLRYGVPEDKSIGAFGEDVFHPEIELFVQALLLSRRVGGNLSDTLERLAKQVRKRQFFRSSAQAAVGMQRGSIWVIVGILAAMQVYLFFVYPEAVTDAWNDELGWQVWQGAFILIFLGVFWVRQVTKIKI